MIKNLTIDDLPTCIEISTLKNRTAGTIPITSEGFIEAFEKYFNNNLDNGESFMSYIDYVDKSSLINDFTQANEGYEKVLNYMLDDKNLEDTRTMGLEKLVKNLKFNFLT